MIIFISLLGSILALVIFILGKRNEHYWKKRGVIFYSKNKLLGPILDFLVQDRSMFEIFEDIYKQYRNAPAVGFGCFLTPAIFVRDPQNLQFIFTSEFHSFNHRGVVYNENDILADNILCMNGIRWKLMRQHMTPLFTASKLKNMYYIINKSAQDFVDYLKCNPDKLKGDAYQTLNWFCCAAVGGAVFGVTTESIFDSPFLEMAEASSATTMYQKLKLLIGCVSVTLFKLLRIEIFETDKDFFVGVIKQLIRQREKETNNKFDFGDLCVSLQRNGNMKDPDTGYELAPTDELLAAQAFFYFTAGVEPCALTIFNTLVELGKHPDILIKVQDEIDRVYKKNNGQMTFDVMSEMEFLDMVISETLRMYPPISHLTRQCVRDTMLPVGNIRIDKGTKIITSVHSLHYDPEYFPNPEVFDPERFMESQPTNVNYLAFGKGGRVCIGMRYARLQVKACLVNMLRHFSIKIIGDVGKVKFVKHHVQVRRANIDLEFVPRTK